MTSDKNIHSLSVIWLAKGRRVRITSNAPNIHMCLANDQSVNLLRPDSPTLGPAGIEELLSGFTKEPYY